MFRWLDALIEHISYWLWNGADGWHDYNHRALAVNEDRTDYENELLASWNERVNYGTGDSKGNKWQW